MGKRLSFNLSWDKGIFSCQNEKRELEDCRAGKDKKKNDYVYFLEYPRGRKKDDLMKSGN